MSAGEGPSARSMYSREGPHAAMRRPLRSRNRSRLSRPRGGGTPLSKNARASRSASAAASPPSLRGLASPASTRASSSSSKASSSSSSPRSLDSTIRRLRRRERPSAISSSLRSSSSSSSTTYSPNAAAACVCSAARASSFRALSSSGASPPGSSASGTAYSMGFFGARVSVPANGTDGRPTNLAATLAASNGVAACPVNISSSSTVKPPSPLGASAANPSPRPTRADCEFCVFIASSSSSPSP
mmetsp:Transcript_13560/g.57890  ORF Transcript_13560/g.57890 Transcript_13560/m.57890 type:complete len:244 (+) Transcript_13560:2039-2770(+)